MLSFSPSNWLSFNKLLRSDVLQFAWGFVFAIDFGLHWTFNNLLGCIGLTGEQNMKCWIDYIERITRYKSG